MKKLSAAILLAVSIPILIFALAMAGAAFFQAFKGFTFNEDVISECEQKHPYSTIGQLVCQDRVVRRHEASAKEQRAKGCVEDDKKRMYELVSRVRQIGIDASSKNIAETVKTIKATYPDLSTELRIDKNQNGSFGDGTMIVGIRTICASGYRVLINLDSDKDNKPKLFRVWEKTPPNSKITTPDDGTTEVFLEKYYWAK